MIIVCSFCNKETEALRKSKKFCSDSCARRARAGAPTERDCKQCGTTFAVISQADANRRYCSKECSKRAQYRQQKDWRDANPERSEEFRKKWISKNDGYYADKKREDREEILAALGGACAVCGVTKSVWLHIDYKPTCVGLQYRHSRGKRFILSHLDDFRLLCANHHYELTLTGRIEGSDITQ